MTRIVAIDPLKRPRPADTARATFVVAVAALLRSLADCEELPEPVMAAADQVRQAVTGLGGRDIGPPP